MNDPFFSVIVPEHNSAEFMRKGLDSIKAQTFTDYELIIVCDACVDDTVKIAKEYTKKVYQINMHRCGLARNKGLDMAKGEWVIWMDDDDWWMNDKAFDTIAKNVGKHGEDIFAFGFEAANLMKRGLHYYFNSPNFLWPAIWNKAWRRDFIGDHRFPDWKHSDDGGFAKEMHPLAKVAYWNEVLYHYNFMRSGSLTDRMRRGEFG